MIMETIRVMIIITTMKIGNNSKSRHELKAKIKKIVLKIGKCEVNNN